MHVDGKVRRFHAMKTAWGITKFIDLKTFSDPMRGYLIDNTCVFGAEVFVVKNTFTGVNFTMKKEPPTYSYTWRVSKFSTLHDERYESEYFGCYNWKVMLYPNGALEGRGNSIGLSLYSDGSNIPANSKLLVGFKLLIKDRINGKHFELKRVRALFYPPNLNFGWGDFMSLAKLKDPSQGFLVDDTCVVEAEVTFLGLLLTG
ncbi:hypothetical protein LWI28_027085 [Acer negundo]|uniref:MATH domain-containing protein n=1 Tax=Acer negundo TaxID=4023 RepID=A0AAD5NV49_ACENE|nr:hypothetical protein LWI28_027085 [Acer negundo]